MGISFFSGDGGIVTLSFKVLKDLFLRGFPSVSRQICCQKLFRLKELAAGCDAELLSSPSGSSMDEGQEGEACEGVSFAGWLVEPPFFVLIFVGGGT